MEKNRIVILLGLLIVIVIGFFYFVNPADNSDESAGPTPTDQEQVNPEDLELFATPEHMKNPENHNLQMEITGPEGETIYPSQARMYKAYLSGNAKYESAKIFCDWNFYLNENNEEVLYKELDNTSIINEGEKEVCGFTSTHMDKLGVLRVELIAVLKTFAGAELETVKAERFYTVTK
jgi:hypothetical protein